MDRVARDLTAELAEGTKLPENVTMPIKTLSMIVNVVEKSRAVDSVI